MPIVTISPPSLSCQLSSTLSRFKRSSHHHHHHQMLSLLESCRSPREFDHLHARIIRRGEAADPFVATRMLEFCAAVSRDMATAVSFFASLDRLPNVYMWTAMIRGFVTVKNPQKAIEFYDLMRSLGVQPYKFTFVFVLKAYSGVQDRLKGTTVHGSVVKVGLWLDMYVRSALVNMYNCCGDINAAHRLFGENPENNSVIWNAMIAGCFANGEIDRARKLFDEMPERDVTAWNVTINGYSKLGNMDVSRALFNQMPERDLLSWSSMIVGYVQSGRAAEALELFQEMLLTGVRPDGVMMASALSACSQVGALEMGKWIHAYVDKNKLKCDVVLGTSLVDMYAKCGCIDLALQVFNGMAHKNVSSWNAMLGGLAMHGHGDDALALFGKMELASLEPTDVTFIAVLSACSHIGAVDEGRRQFDRMLDEFKIAPKIEHYGCMVDLLSRAGLVTEARDLILNMPMEPNLVVLGAFLTACKIHSDLNTGEQVMKHISRLDPGDGGCYVLISNIYASKNQWDRVATMRKLIKGMGVRKIPGCSSIEVNCVVHEFVVEDKSHHNWREVFEVIDKLGAHLEVEGYVPDSLLVVYDIDEELV